MRTIDCVRAAVIVTVVIALLIGVWTTVTTRAALAQGGNEKLDIYDNCDPLDPAWASVGGCDLEPRGGDVTVAEFGRLLLSPLSSGTVGHPSFRFEPSNMTLEFGKRLHAENEGGRTHTFTEVVAFGGGRIGGFNVGLTTAPECVLAPGAADPTQLPPDGSLDLTNLGRGVHTFQCCFHPWMRSAVDVK